MIFSEEDCGEWRSDVCPGAQNGNDGGVIWIDVVELEVALRVESR